MGEREGGFACLRSFDPTSALADGGREGGEKDVWEGSFESREGSEKETVCEDVEEKALTGSEGGPSSSLPLDSPLPPASIG